MTENKFDFHVSDIKEDKKAKECIANMYFTNSEVIIPSRDFFAYPERMFQFLLYEIANLKDDVESVVRIFYSTYVLIFKKSGVSIDVYYEEKYKIVTVLKCGVEVEEYAEQKADRKIFYHGNFDDFVKHVYELALNLRNALDASGCKLRSVNGLKCGLPLFEDFMDERAGKPKKKAPKKEKSVRISMEERRQIKEREKLYKELAKQIGRSYKMKFRSGTLYYVHDGFIVSIWCSFWGKSNTIQYRAHKKRLAYDDILWEILEMESNKEQPIFLHAVGAFTVGGIRLADNDFAAISLENDPKKIINDILTEVKKQDSETDENFDEKLIRQIEEEDDEATTLKFVVYIYLKQYDKARELAAKCLKNHDEGQFGDIHKSFFELGLEYMNKKGL